MMNQFGMGMNFGMQNMQNQMGMNGNNPFMGMNFQGGDQEWLKGFTLGVQEVQGTSEDAVDDNTPRINIIFTTTKGTKRALVIPHGTTIDKTLEKYLKKMGNEDLYKNKTDRICFLFGGTKLKFGDQTKVENFFGMNTNPNVIVNDVYNLIGAKNF